VKYTWNPYKCAGCGKEIPPDDYYLYEGRPYHFRCLPPEAKKFAEAEK